MTGPAETAFWNLVAAARADGGISGDEQKILNARLLRLGLEPGRAREIQAAAEAESPPRIRVPQEGKARLDTLRAVLEVAAADGSIAPQEMAVIRALAERCAIPSGTLSRLLALALRGSAHKLERAFASLAGGTDLGPELVELAGPARESTGGLLRSMPFAARLAPPARHCEGCGFAFGERNAYSRYCRHCYAKRGVRNVPAAMVELRYAVLFLILFVISAYVVQKTTGLWSWGHEAAVKAVWRGLGRRRGGGGIAYLTPAFIVSLLPAWMGVWGFAALVRRFRSR